MRPLRLHTRISLVLTGLAGSLCAILVGLWLHGARQGIHEEIEAANRVSGQWLAALVERLPANAADLQAALAPLGRIRANELQVLDAAGRLHYRSPPPTYKAGRQAPDWFAALLRPQIAPRVLAVGELQLRLVPDASRAVIDAWDDLCAVAGWALGLLGLLFVVVRRALDRALQPLDEVMRALERIGYGRFDLRLPVFPVPELASLSKAFNGMADRLRAAVDDNVRLETERELAQRLQARLEEERRQIARELHDEMAQGITAVRALAGAVIQRTAEQPVVQAPAQHILAVTGELQDGVRRILHRLRPAPGGLAAQLANCCGNWRRQHETVDLQFSCALAGGDPGAELAGAVLRIVQEGLTNVARHAGASRVEVNVSGDGAVLRVALIDNGRGAGVSAAPGCGLGLTGMRERVSALGGELHFLTPAGGGFGLLATLPILATEESSLKPQLTAYLS
jgi:two-component system sensor histidine kinase UhpB